MHKKVENSDFNSLHPLYTLLCHGFCIHFREAQFRRNFYFVGEPYQRRIVRTEDEIIERIFGARLHASGTGKSPRGWIRLRQSGGVIVVSVLLLHCYGNFYAALLEHFILKTI